MTHPDNLDRLRLPEAEAAHLMSVIKRDDPVTFRIGAGELSGRIIMKDGQLFIRTDMIEPLGSAPAFAPKTDFPLTLENVRDYKVDLLSFNYQLQTA